MVKSTMVCSDDMLQLVVHGEEQDERFAEATEHVESCFACQSRLEGIAANNDDWAEAASMLSAEETALDLEVEGTQRAWSSLAHRHPPKSWTDSMTSQLLAPPSHPEMLGRLGRYEIEQFIGSGGMGVVFKGFDSELNRPVAVKALAPHLAGSGAARQRFAREARAAAAVVHEHVVAIHNVESDNEPPFLVMQYVSGESLQGRLDRTGPMSVVEVLRIAHQTAAGLSAAHEQGLVHRDVKPSNILLESQVDRAMLTDFGLARANDDASLTHSGHALGTPHYMSPEQARGENVDQRTDLFSLGSVMYAMCTGRSPFRAETTYGILRRITDDDPRSVQEINPDIPAWLCQIIEKLLAKKPEDRFQSAQQVAQLLEDCLAHVQQPATVPLPSRVRSLAKAKKCVTKADSNKRFRNRGLVTAIGAFAFCLLGLLLWRSVEAPKIAGEWTGEGWGHVVLREVGDNKYEGTYDDTFGDEDGQLNLTWSKIEHRFNGKWREGKDRFGKVSVRLVDGEIRGAWTTSKNSAINPARPKLADLLWTRLNERAMIGESNNHTVDPNGGSNPLLEDFTERVYDRSPGTIRNTGASLIDAVRLFNKTHGMQGIGQNQPPLTDDEVVASIRWRANVRSDLSFPAKATALLKSIVDQRVLPRNSFFDVTTTADGTDGVRFQTWTICLWLPGNDGKRHRHVVRDRTLWELDANGEPKTLDKVDTASQTSESIPLAAAIHAFNSTHQSLAGEKQPRLIEQEVVAAIRRWKAKRDKAPVTNGEFAAFQKIAETRVFPKDVQFEIISHFEPGDGFKYQIWSVRILTPQTSKPGWTYAYTIREKFVRVEPIHQGPIHWGPAAENGLQAGLQIDPQNEVYVEGQLVTPVFFFKNVSDKTLDFDVPNIMTRGYYDKISVVDQTGKDIPIDQESGSGGPVGWLGHKLPPGETYRMTGMPIVMGKVKRGSAETAIHATPEQTIHITFTVPNFGDSDAESIETGQAKLKFTVLPTSDSDEVKLGLPIPHSFKAYDEIDLEARVGNLVFASTVVTVADETNDDSLGNVVETHKQLLRSHAVLKMAVESLTPDDRTRLSLGAEPIGWLAKNLVIRDHDAYAVTIGLLGKREDEELLTRYVHAVQSSYEDFVKETTKDVAGEVGEILLREYKSSRDRLEEKCDAYIRLHTRDNVPESRIKMEKSEIHRLRKLMTAITENLAALDLGDSDKSPNAPQSTSAEDKDESQEAPDESTADHVSELAGRWLLKTVRLDGEQYRKRKPAPVIDDPFASSDSAEASEKPRVEAESKDGKSLDSFRRYMVATIEGNGICFDDPKGHSKMQYVYRINPDSDPLQATLSISDRSLKGLVAYSKQGLSLCLAVKPELRDSFPKSFDEEEHLFLHYERDPTDPHWLMKGAADLRAIARELLLKGMPSQLETASEFLILAKSMDAEAVVRQQVDAAIERAQELRRSDKKQQAKSAEQEADSLSARADAIAAERMAEQQIRSHERRIREEVDQLNARAGALRAEQRYAEAQVVEKQLRSLLHSRDPDLKKANDLKSQASRARLDGKHDVADDLEKKALQLLEKVTDRYKLKSDLRYGFPSDQRTSPDENPLD